MAPPIRYPLPTLLATILAAFLIWKGEAWTRPVRASAAERWRRLWAGPPVPSSPNPRRDAGPFGPRVLLLHAETAVSAAPDGPAIETISRRLLADVYDVWPLNGEPTHYRVGTRRAIGWVRAADVLPWSTRLVVRAKNDPLSLRDAADPAAARINIDQVPIPVIDRDGGRFKVAVWTRDGPWSEIERIGHVAPAEVELGVLLSREEILAILTKPEAFTSASIARVLRLEAIAGRINSGRDDPPAEILAAEKHLSTLVLGTELECNVPIAEKRERLTRMVEEDRADATWSGLAFRFVPVCLLP